MILTAAATRRRATCCDRVELANAADVPHPRPAGHLLRRRAGLHRRHGRRQGRPAGHVRHPDAAVRDEDDLLGPAAPSAPGRALRHERAALPARSRSSPTLRAGPPGPRRRRPDPPVRLDAGRHLRVQPDRRRTTRSSTSSPPTTRPTDQVGDVRHLQRAACGSRRCYGDRHRPSAPTRTAGCTVTVPPLSVRGVEGRPRRWPSRERARPSTSTTPARRWRSSAAGPRSAPPSAGRAASPR